MSDSDRTPSERKALRSVAILKLTGRNEGEPGKTLGEAIYAVFADCCEAGSEGDLEETDPVVLSALDGWLNLDIALGADQALYRRSIAPNCWSKACDRAR